MQQRIERLGAAPYLFLGVSLVFIGLVALDQISNIWLFDPAQHIDLLRKVALDEADSTMLLDAALPGILFAFLALVLATVTGLALPLVYYVNRRFQLGSGHYLVILRQAMWLGIWASFCSWLQMNRALTWPVAVLVLAILLLFELLLQIRGRAVAVHHDVTGQE